ncbi:phage tail tape measure protein, partial [Beijerinckia sp. L45]|uniref:phage tail tape measure protein n=1 Tax=Beijerinckia sp. L45 TaxID=1641855 RepID=UPI00131C8D35
MAETLKDFFAGVGFKLDEVSQTQSENAVKRTEERNTAKVKAETKKREATEKAAIAARDKARRDADQKQAARMKASLKNAQSFALRFSGVQAAIAMATSLTAIGISDAVSKAAAGFERLAYLGKLSDASPANVTAFGYAAEQTGSSRQEADAALTAFGRKLHIARTGYAKYLEQLGVQTRDAAGNFRDSADILTDLGDKMRTTRDTKDFGYANAIGVGQSLGLPEFLSRAVMDPAFRQREAEQKAIQGRAGADPNAAAAGGTVYMQSLRRLDEVIKAVETRVETVLFVKLKPFLDKLADWFLANGNRIADIVSKIADDLIRLAVAIGEKLAAADWDQILKRVEDLAKRLSELVGPLTGDKSLIVLIGSLGLALAGLSAVIMPRWLMLLLGVGVVASLGLGKAEAAEPGEVRARDEGGGGGRAGLGARIARGVRKLTGVDALRARGRKATDARHAEANAPSRPLTADVSGQKIVGGANLMSGGQYPGAQPGANLTTIKLKDGHRLTVHADAAPSFQRFFNQ